MTGELQTYSLDRTGRPPLSFEGEFLAGGYGTDLMLPTAKSRNPRWHDLEVYRTGLENYVLHLRYRTEWKDEIGHDDVLVRGRPQDVVLVLRDYNPLFHVVGYPPGARFVRKQQRLLAEVRARYDACVSELLGQLGPEFAERIR